MKRTVSVLLLLLLGCGPSYESGKTECSDKLECPSGFVCGRAQTGGTPVCYDQSAIGCQDGQFYCAGLGQCVSSMSKCSGGQASTMSKAEICQETGGLTCASVLKCYPGQMTESDCLQSFVASCCEDDGVCQDTVNLSQSSYQQCMTDLSSMSCTDWENTSIPDSCLSL